MKKLRKKKPVGAVKKGDVVTAYTFGGAIFRGTLAKNGRDAISLCDAEKYEDGVLYPLSSVTVEKSEICGFGYSRGREAIIEQFEWELTAHVPKALKNLRIHRSRRG